MGMWYYSEIYVPRSTEEKKLSVTDLKNRRCLFISIAGNFSQICNLLLQTDKFNHGSALEVKQYKQLVDQISSSPKPILFDDVHNLKGVALSLDVTCDIEETSDEIRVQISSKKQMIYLRISPGWSLGSDVDKLLNGI